MTLVTLHLPEPPSLNVMLDWAKQRAKIATATGYRYAPIVYAQKKAAYEQRAALAFAQQGFFKPREPWRQWCIEYVLIRRHNLLDIVEAMSCLKWPVDSLVKAGRVAGDSPRELLSVPIPEQVIDRKNRGVTLVIRDLTGA